MTTGRIVKVYPEIEAGRVIADVGWDHRPDWNLGGYSVVADALAGWTRDDAWVLREKLYRVVARPVENEVNGAPVGAIVALSAVDDRFADSVSRRTGTAVAFYALGTRIATGAPVIPIAVTSAKCWPRKAFIKYPGVVDVSIGKPISSVGRQPDELMREVETWIEAEMRRLSLPFGARDAAGVAEAFRPLLARHFPAVEPGEVGQASERKDPLSGETITNRPSRVLRPGMVLTIEPGLYVRPAEGVPEQFWNIGIRIEDDAVVTEAGCELITRDVPVQADAIEALMRG